MLFVVVGECNVSGRSWFCRWCALGRETVLHTSWLCWKENCLPGFKPGETAGTAAYFFLAACLAATACFFFWLALAALEFFCEDFFWFDFGDLSPMSLTFLTELTACGIVVSPQGPSPCARQGEL